MEKLADLITLREASKISGYNPDYLGFLIREGQLRGKKVGRNWLTTREDIKYYLQNQTVRQEVSKKRSALSLGFMVVAISLLVTFAAYFAYMVLYQNAYDQVSVTAASSGRASSTQNTDQVDGIVQTIVQ